MWAWQRKFINFKDLKFFGASKFSFRPILTYASSERPELRKTLKTLIPLANKWLGWYFLNQRWSCSFNITRKLNLVRDFISRKQQKLCCKLVERYYFIHGTIIRKAITCKKIACYMRDSAFRWFIVKKPKIFWSYVKHFWVLADVRKCRILIGVCNWAFLNCPTIFLDCHNKTYCQLLFLAFNSFNEKTNFLIMCYFFNRYNLSIL